MQYFNILVIAAALLVNCTNANGNTITDKQNYRYSFDIVGSSISIGGGLRGMESCEGLTCEKVDDEAIYQEFLNLYHPFGWASGKMGRVVFETSYRVVISGGIGGDQRDYENTATCVSGFLCASDGGLKFNQTQPKPNTTAPAPGMISKKLQDIFSGFDEAGFDFYTSNYFILNLDGSVNGAKSGAFQFLGDDFFGFSGYVNGTRYVVQGFADATFQLENATVERLDPPAVPLAASGIAMFSMVGAGLVLSIIRRRNNPAV